MGVLKNTIKNQSIIQGAGIFGESVSWHFKSIKGDNVFYHLELG